MRTLPFTCAYLRIAHSANLCALRKHSAQLADILRTLLILANLLRFTHQALNIRLFILRTPPGSCVYLRIAYSVYTAYSVYLLRRSADVLYIPHLLHAPPIPCVYLSIAYSVYIIYSINIYAVCQPTAQAACAFVAYCALHQSYAHTCVCILCIQHVFRQSVAQYTGFLRSQLISCAMRTCSAYSLRIAYATLSPHYPHAQKQECHTPSTTNHGTQYFGPPSPQCSIKLT